ncbi:MAG: hypothetical protein AAF483_19205 [Planctomycetota bacterium]
MRGILLHYKYRILCLLAVFTVSGCSSIVPEFEPYGAVQGVDAKRSVNGLYVHRKMWESTGSRCLYPRKLSPRLDNFDSIVLVGQSFGPPGKAAREWLEDWLGRGKNRTVIYFGRDFNADLYYRKRTLSSVPTDEQDRASIDYAMSRSGELHLRMRQVSESTFCRWFYYDTSQTRKEYGASDFKGPWASDLAGLSGTWPVGITLQLPDRTWQNQLPTWLQPAGAKPANPLQGASEFLPEAEDGNTTFSAWSQDELATKEMWDDEFDDLFKSKTLLATKDGRPLVFQLNSLQEPTSKIILVANGAPFLNAYNHIQLLANGRLISK